jgi:phosphohistidine phosphatase
MLAIPPPLDARQSSVEMPNKQLFVLRHAKSSWDNPGLDDHERPLAPRGRRAAELLAGHLRENGISPALVLCSSARRTRETLEGVAPGGEVSIEDELYGATTSALVERLQRVPDDVGSVMLIGHNPALQMLVLRLAGSTRAAAADGYLAEVERKFPTGALATLEFDAPWSELAPGSARLTAYVVPKSLA